MSRQTRHERGQKNNVSEYKTTGNSGFRHANEVKNDDLSDTEWVKLVN